MLFAPIYGVLVEVLHLLGFHQLKVIVVLGVLQLIVYPIFLFHFRESELELLVVAVDHDSQLYLALVRWHNLLCVVLLHYKLPVASLADATRQVLSTF